METFPNSCFAGFYRRIGKYSKDLEKYDQGSEVMTDFEVATRDSVDQQFLSHNLSDDVATKSTR